MRFDGGLKIKFLGWSILIIGLFIFLPNKALAGTCWGDYPKAGTPIPGFPTASDFTLPGNCVADPAKDCSEKGYVVGPKGMFGCAPAETCCLVPAKTLSCFNDYVGSDRTSFQSVSCVKSDAQCAAPNKKLGDGHGCSDANGGTVCCAILSSSGKSGGASSGGTVPKTGSTAKWSLGVQGGMQLVPCTETGNCTIDDLVNQGVNFAKWIMGLAGALFLLVFVYGGAMYTVSFGRSDYITKGKNAMTRGAFGIILVMGAWTVVSYVSTSLGYKPVGLGGTAAQTDQTALCANTDSSFMGCVPQADKCLTWCKQVYGASTSGDVDVSKNCSDGPANSCSKGQKCCVLTR
jgi:hypothetical protein